MTDRIHSCKQSPDGRHQVDPTTETATATCRFCRRLLAPVAPHVGWNVPADDPDGHLGAVDTE